MSDFVAYLDRAHREITSKGTERTLVIRQTYPTSADDLWNAVTDPERIPRWFLPVSGDLREGGRFALEGNASGDIRTCDAPSHLGLTWEGGGATSYVDVRISPVDGDRAELSLVHTADVPDELWDQFGGGAVGVGWDGAILGLALHLEGGSIDDPGAWMASDDGKAFYTASSRLWGDAQIADGDDPTAVAGRVERCTAAYTGG